jgi:hypothetical protein
MDSLQAMLAAQAPMFEIDAVDATEVVAEDMSSVPLPVPSDDAALLDDAGEAADRAIFAALVSV